MGIVVEPTSGLLRITIVAVTTTATDLGALLKTAGQAGHFPRRTDLELQNLGPGTLTVGSDAQVTSGQGRQVLVGESWPVPLSAQGTLYLIGDAPASVCVSELQNVA